MKKKIAIFGSTGSIGITTLSILKKDKSYVGIAPGAGESNKIWSAKNFIEICNYFESKQMIIVFFTVMKKTN